MSEVKDKNLGIKANTPLKSLYLGKIMTSSIAEEEISRTDQTIAAWHLLDTIVGLHSVTIGSDEYLPKMIVDIEVEAENDVDAMTKLCQSAIEAWKISKKDPSELMLVAAFLAESNVLDSNRDQYPILEHNYYVKEELKTGEIDVWDDPVVVQVGEIFYNARDAVA
jgi:hypothetical protein